ncbi:helix-turn-helix domain-containing protein [Pseudomonas stutzeri]|uniref:helix-turn-helix domain-containing protein n=1 Tax=Stutzerimonas stutzeri TaxID=316 RepID=UPI00210AD699|nr:helix-turn-helix transcriptional regulator [Stutzerimonas stutzeri]MCQ4289550.1 helix-turn-helix domain-containing protein [Stutzerimonas stutzeri]
MNQISTPGRPMSIGENLKAKRKVAGLSQPAMAEIAGVSKNTYISWEKDETTPKATEVAEMAKYFGCSTDELIFEKEERSIKQELRAIFRRFDSLPEELKPQARTMLRSVLLSLEEEASRREEQLTA